MQLQTSRLQLEIMFFLCHVLSQGTEVKNSVEDVFWENVIYMHRDRKPVVVLEVLTYFGVTHPAAAEHIRYKAASTSLPMSMQTGARKGNFLIILAECPF